MTEQAAIDTSEVSLLVPRCTGLVWVLMVGHNFVLSLSQHKERLPIMQIANKHVGLRCYASQCDFSPCERNFSTETVTLCIVMHIAVSLLN